MTYVGNTPLTQSFAPGQDVFSGDGTTTTFQLTRAVNSILQVTVQVNNVIQNPLDPIADPTNSSYDIISGNRILFSEAPSLGTNNVIVRYTTPSTLVSVPGAKTVGPIQLSAEGVPSNLTFLRGDNTWAAVPVTTAVTTFSGGTTGFTPAVATSNAITLAGTLVIANGGTGATTAGAALTNLGAAASGNNNDITRLSALATAITPAQGGTGLTALTANALLIGNGTSPVSTVAPGAAGNVLTSNGTSWASVAATGGATGQNGQTITASGTFTVPAGVTTIKVTGAGGGAGGGGGADPYQGGNGGAAGVGFGWLTNLTPGNTIAVTIGNAGTGGFAGGTDNATDGTDTTFSTMTFGRGFRGRTGSHVSPGANGANGSVTGATALTFNYFPDRGNGGGGGQGGSPSYNGGNGTPGILVLEY